MINFLNTLTSHNDLKTNPQVMSKFLSMIICLFSASIILSGCTTLNKSSQEELPAVKMFTAADIAPQNLQATYEDDVFKVGDRLDVTVHGFDRFSGSYSVDRAGMTNFVHIGELPVAGASITDLQKTVQDRYAACCLQRPSVSITKESKALGTIVVDGAVNAPGSFELDKVIKLSEAIALAGGATEAADRERAILSRDFSGERRIMLVNLDEVQTAGAYDPLVYPSDVVFMEDDAGHILYTEFLNLVPVAILIERILDNQ